jgi:signal-transduction protein with cAMP-binding, CBS, and nucleotidyltransferase domain
VIVDEAGRFAGTITAANVVRLLEEHPHVVAQAAATAGAAAAAQQPHVEVAR